MFVERLATLIEVVLLIVLAVGIVYLVERL